MYKGAEKSLAVSGGANSYELCIIPEFELFFRCIRTFAFEGLSAEERILITDRLYKRYVRDEDVPALIVGLTKVRACFAKVSAASVDWKHSEISATRSELLLGRNMLDFVWNEELERITKCAGRVLGRIDLGVRWERPLVVTRADFASMLREKKRPLAEYDALEGPPFWLAEPGASSPPRWYKDGQEVAAGTPGAVSPDYVSPDNSTAIFVHKLE